MRVRIQTERRRDLSRDNLKSELEFGFLRAEVGAEDLNGIDLTSRLEILRL